MHIGVLITPIIAVGMIKLTLLLAWYWGSYIFYFFLCRTFNFDICCGIGTCCTHRPVFEVLLLTDLKTMATTFCTHKYWPRPMILRKQVSLIFTITTHCVFFTSKCIIVMATVNNCSSTSFTSFSFLFVSLRWQRWLDVD